MSFNEVFATFGGTSNAWLENDHWVVLTRPKQVTLGSSILMAKRSLLLIGELTDEELLAFGEMCRQVEERLRKHFAFDKINYLMLGMRDPQLHFHVLPRYAKDRQFAGRTWTDSAWPNPPDLNVVLDDPVAVAEIRQKLSVA